MKSITGKYRIVEMEQWDLDFVHAQGEGYFFFSNDGLGEFMFGYVEGDIDYREVEGSSKQTKVEYSWFGNDEMDEATGRGWFEMVSDDEIYGVFYFHRGEESWVKAKRLE